MADPQGKPKAKLAKARRIYRLGDAYICGLCHKRYRSVENAKKCLIRDAKTMPDTGEQQRRFRCGHCQSVYDNKEDARACAARCKEKLEAATLAEQKQEAAEEDLIAKFERQLSGETPSETESRGVNPTDLKMAAVSEPAGWSRRDEPRGEAWARKPAEPKDPWAHKPADPKDPRARKPAPEEKVETLPEDVAFSDYTDLREFGFDRIIAQPDERELPREVEAERRRERRMYMRVGIKYRVRLAVTVTTQRPR